MRLRQKGLHFCTRKTNVPSCWFTENQSAIKINHFGSIVVAPTKNLNSFLNLIKKWDSINTTSRRMNFQKKQEHLRGCLLRSPKKQKPSTGINNAFQLKKILMPSRLWKMHSRKSSNILGWTWNSFFVKFQNGKRYLNRYCFKVVIL